MLDARYGMLDTRYWSFPGGWFCHERRNCQKNNSKGKMNSGKMMFDLSVQIILPARLHVRRALNYFALITTSKLAYMNHCEVGVQNGLLSGIRRDSGGRLYRILQPACGDSYGRFPPAGRRR